MPRRSLTALISHYRSVLSSVRLCQLYAYLLLFELLLYPILMLVGGVLWVLGAGVAVLGGWDIPAYIATEPSSSRSVIEAVYLANIWVIFWYFAGFRRGYWVLALCLVGLGHNVLVTYQGTFIEDGGLQIQVEGHDLRSQSFLTASLFFIGILLSHLYYLAIAWRGQRSIHALGPDEACIASELGGTRRAAVAASMALINIPRTIRYSHTPLWTGSLQAFAGVANFVNFWIVTMAFIALCMLPVILTLVGPPAVSVAYYVSANGWDPNASRAALLVGTTLFLLALVFVSMPMVVYFLGRLTLKLARRTMQRSLREIQGEDERAPILFLRSFLDDQVALKPRRFLFEQWLLDGTSRSMTLDYLILSEGTEYGPTVALGNPEDPAPPYGVIRGYFDHASWQGAVEGLSERSSALIVVLDGTEGLEWEVSHIVAHQYVAKSLFLLAPEDSCSARGRTLLGQVLEACGQPPGVDVGGERVIGFWVNASGHMELLMADVPDVYAYLLTIRLFLRTKLGDRNRGEHDFRPASGERP